MGRWSRHPMGSDGALDAKDSFMEDYDKEDLYYFERDPSEIHDILANLSLDELKKLSNKEYVYENKFVIPYIFLEYNVYPTDPEIKEFLLECLDYHEDFEEYGNGEEDQHVQYFKDNFEEIISGKMELPDDEGLFAAMAKQCTPGIINKTKDN